MPFELSECIGLTTLQPDEAVKLYTELFGMTQSPSHDGLKLSTGKLAFFLDPGPRQPPILELLTEDLIEARPILRALGFEEQTWHGPGKLNLVTDPFGIAWNIFQSAPESEWPSLPTTHPAIPAKIALHLHETQRAAQFYADVFEESATKTPAGWTIDSNQIRLIIEPGLPQGPAFYVDPQACPDPQSLTEFFEGRSCTVDQHGVTWKLISRPTSEMAVIHPQA